MDSYDMKSDQEQHRLARMHRDEKRGKGHRHIGRKNCGLCTGSSVGKALHKGHGNMKKYWSNRLFSDDEMTIFGDGDYFEEPDTSGYDENGVWYEYSDEDGAVYPPVVVGGVFYQGYFRPWPRDWYSEWYSCLLYTSPSPRDS